VNSPGSTGAFTSTQGQAAEPDEPVDPEELEEVELEDDPDEESLLLVAAGTEAEDPLRESVR
jgi:hypothetical protein